MHHVRGNHDAMLSDQIAVNAAAPIELTGVTLAVLDTVRPGVEHGRITGDQLDWLDELAGASTDRCSCSATITPGTRARPSATTTTSGSTPTTARRCAA